MKDTVKLKHKKNTKIIAHRGLSGIEKENTNAAFIAAANRSYFGIEADVQVSLDGEFIIIHDKTTRRVADIDYVIEKTPFSVLRELTLKPKRGGQDRNDLKIPSLEEYISICQSYGKKAVLELKNKMEPHQIYEIMKRIKKADYLDDTIMISFSLSNLSALRKNYPNQPAQYISYKLDDKVYRSLLDLKLDLDIHFGAADKEIIDKCHKNGIKVNCWTVDNIGDAERLIDYGVDYISTNILE